MSDSDDDILREVRERYKHCSDVESDARSRYRDDLRFLHGDAYNHDQWNPDVYRARNPPGGGGRPCLTINKTAQHVLQVTNDARQQQMGVKIVATGFGASAKAAEVLEGIVRHIEAQSNAQQNAYANAILCQVGGGIGYVHVVTDYVKGVDTFDQDVFIEAVLDPLTVFCDPDTQQPDHSDAMWGMVVTTMARAEFDAQYPGDKDVGELPFSGSDYRADDWDEKDKVRVAKYYRRSEETDTLWQTPAGNIRESVLRQQEGGEDFIKALAQSSARRRHITEPFVEWFLIGGDRVIDRGDTVFKSIPLVPFIGIETTIDGKLDRKGLTRALLDPQRMFNFSGSKFMEGLAAQTVGSWIASDAQVEGREAEWAGSNIAPPGVLIYNSKDPDTGEPIMGSPEVVPPPQFSPGYLQAMQSSDLQMQMASGQYQAEMGAPGNERTGIAIQQRQRQSDTANYHFTDNQGMALRCIGRLILDAIPAIYDVQRAVQVVGLDGSQTQAIINPSLPSAHQVELPPNPQAQRLPNGQLPQNLAPEGMGVEDQMQLQGAVLAVNPNVGRYDVLADVGPAYGTQRQETFNALMQAVAAAPEIMQKCGDLLFRSADFPLADEIADRLKPASQDPAAQAAQQQIQALQVQIGQLTQQLKDKSADQALKQAQLQHDKVADAMSEDTDRYKAETDRMAAIGSVDPSAFMPLIKQLIQEAMGGQQSGATPASPPPQSPPDAGSVPAAMPRLPTNNPPGGPIHAAVPVNGDVQ